MTRKDYIAIARALSSQQPTARFPDDLSEEERAARVQWTADCCAIASELAIDNPRFDRDRFLTACSD